MNNLLTMNELENEEIVAILDQAQRFIDGEVWSPAKQTFVANLFFEPSTRTKTSFEMAEKKLKLDVLSFEASTSSVLKGETLFDTVKTFEAIGADVLVIRHEEDQYFNQLKGKINIPILNGGDGQGHHPTQSLLDLLTIRQQFGGFTALKVAIVGDISHSRVARSNAEALAKLGANVSFSGPKSWFSGNFLEKGRYISMDEAVEEADVMMLLRIQHERHSDEESLSQAFFHEKYGLTVEREKQMKDNSIIMHPGPVNRDVEIADELVECTRSHIFKQIQNGVFIRMAVLKRAIEGKGGNKSWVI